METEWSSIMQEVSEWETEEVGIEAKLAECFESAPGLQHNLSSSSLVSEMKTWLQVKWKWNACLLY